jgi:hypothetical protein
MNRFGCMYVAFGRPYLIQALNSVRSLRRASPSVPVCILTNALPEPPAAFHEWNSSSDVWLSVDAADDDNRLFKTDLVRYTPFDRTLYLDSDTEVLGDLTGMFRFLDYWDLALRLREEGYSPLKEKGRQTVLDGAAAIADLPHWNGGVVLFASNARVEEFFSLWNSYYRAGGIPFDQVSLVEAAFRSSCRILSLDGRWNGGHQWGRDRPDQTRYVLHYTFHIDDSLAEKLQTLDRLIFGEAVAVDAAGSSGTAEFVHAR